MNSKDDVESDVVLTPEDVSAIRNLYDSAGLDALDDEDFSAEELVALNKLGLRLNGSDEDESENDE